MRVPARGQRRPRRKIGAGLNRPGCTWRRQRGERRTVAGSICGRLAGQTEDGRAQEKARARTSEDQVAAWIRGILRRADSQERAGGAENPGPRRTEDDFEARRLRTVWPLERKCELPEGQERRAQAVQGGDAEGARSVFFGAARTGEAGARARDELELEWLL